MSIAKIKLINITGNVKDLDSALTRFADVTDFHPILASEIVEKVKGSTTFVAENPWKKLLDDIRDIETRYELILPEDEFRDERYSFNEMFDYMADVKTRLSSELTRIRQLEEHIQKYKDALIQVKNIQSLDIPLEDLFACEFIKLRFGRLPNDSVEKLKFFRTKPYVFKSFNHDENNCWCMYYTSPEYKREVDSIFASLFFERIHIPDFVHGLPSEAVKALEFEIEQDYKMITHYHDDICSITDECKDELSHIKGELLFLNRVFESKKYVVGLGDSFTITGFIESNKSKDVTKMFKDFKSLEVNIEDADSDERIKPPTKIKNGWFAKPFGLFINMYGVPSYNDIDPTPFVAITYSLLFGIMFGDFGQGLVLVLLGALLWHFKKSKLGAVGVRIGMSSMIFGLVYGSVFGNEVWLESIYERIGISFLPLHVMDSDFTMTLLLAAIGLGSLLILISMIFNMITAIKKKNYAELLFSNNGISGFLFYSFVLTAAVLSVGFQISILNVITALFFVVIPLVLIFLKEPLHRVFQKKKMFEHGFGGFFVEGFFELFEIVLSYITNTVSFLRVGGFILSHAGMMLVVNTLMQDASQVGSIAIMIFGNIFVMALEGLIVGIQVLRLEFYEMFSRYYEGNGIPFKAINE
ncbi:MAG: V-type ATPase 116kDa subunit family protein [Acholeplasmataceae bacterium]